MVAAIAARVCSAPMMCKLCIITSLQFIILAHFTFYEGCFRGNTAQNTNINYFILLSTPRRVLTFAKYISALLL